MSAAASRNGSPFHPRVVLAMLLIGALAFLAALYFIGVGETSGEDNDGGGHGAGAGLVGYAALARLLEADGHNVQLIRNPGQLHENGLLILTPPAFADAKDIDQIVQRRRYAGPTLIVLPKWNAMRVPPQLKVKARKGWVVVFGTDSPGWAKEILSAAMEPQIVDRSTGSPPTWHGLGGTGKFPDARAIQTVTSGKLTALVKDDKGQDLVSFLDDGGHYPDLVRLAGESPPASEDAGNEGLQPVIVVAEPDLVDNYALADRDRAMLALRIVDAATGGEKLPISFDLTLNGLGSPKNLFTLAFTPPFLAATLCLLIAAIVVAWRAFRRFGPPMAEEPAIAFGKRQLALNGANLIQRARRLHLLGAPYAALCRARLARSLGLKPISDTERMEAEIDRVLTARSLPGFRENIDALRTADSPHDLLRRAHALKQIERKLER